MKYLLLVVLFFNTTAFITNRFLSIRQKSVCYTNREDMDEDIKDFEDGEDAQDFMKKYKLYNKSKRAFENNEESDDDEPSPLKVFRVIIQNLTDEDPLSSLLGIDEELRRAIQSQSDVKEETEEEEEEEEDNFENYKKRRKMTTKLRNQIRNAKSENFEVQYDNEFSFKNVGGYEEIKDELNQCIDIFTNFTKYSKFNVRVPKGLILEGPPGNGKTLIARAISGESKLPFIAVSGSEFQEKYVGVGSQRVRELFTLAETNKPCIVFIDEIDALGRKRNSDGEAATSERDNTLNQLLVSLDGFKTQDGVFVIGATNRIDLLDPALLRPGRIDKKIYIGVPDEKTRKAIIDIHIQGKPYDPNITSEMLIEITDGLSGAEIENLLNEAMLNALRENREIMNMYDIEIIHNKMIAGWQSNIEIGEEELKQICIHEMGHVVVGLYAKFHSPVKKVVINLNSPRTPGYTIFQRSSKRNMNDYNELFEHIMILLGGRLAEEIVYGKCSASTGASNDFQEAFNTAERMIKYYGFGKDKLIYSSGSDKYKENIDLEIMDIIEKAYKNAKIIITNNKSQIILMANLLKEKKKIEYEELVELLNSSSSP